MPYIGQAPDALGQYTGVVARKNRLKDYQFGPGFYALVEEEKLGSIKVMLSEAHFRTFEPHDRISFDAETKDHEWFYVLAEHRCDNLGRSVMESQEFTLQIDYLGASREREGREDSSTGLIGNEWCVEFPVSVMQSYFDRPGLSLGMKRPDFGEPGPGYFGVLGIPMTDDMSLIKRAWRHAARDSHPDVNQDDPTAEARFKAVQEAYDTLSDPLKLLKYKRVMQMTAEPIISTMGITDPVDDKTYRPRQRCGRVTFKGTCTAGMYHVEQILDWSPIRKARQANFTLQQVEFQDGYVTVPLGRYGFDVENKDLPFDSVRKLNWKQYRRYMSAGLLMLDVLMFKNVWWDKEDSTLSDIGTPIFEWQPVKVRDSRLDRMGRASITAALARIKHNA